MTREQWADIGERAAWTFVQGAAAAVPTGVVVADWSALRVAGTAAVIGGTAAVLSGLKGIVTGRRTR